jgi:hypothetical protein
LADFVLPTTKEALCLRNDEMKKISLGISIILFAILFSLCSTGMDLVSLIIGIIGIVFSIIGYIAH